MRHIMNIKEIKCVRCFDPDYPRLRYYIFEDKIFKGEQCYVIDVDPYDHFVRRISRENGEKEINKFNAIMDRKKDK